MSDTTITPASRDTVCPPENDRVTVRQMSAGGYDSVTIDLPHLADDTSQFEDDEQVMFAAICQLVSEYARRGATDGSNTSWTTNWRCAVEAVYENLECEERLMRGLPLYLTDAELRGEKL